MKISREGAILAKNISVKCVWCTKAVGWIVRQCLETWKHRQFAEENPQDGFVLQPDQAAADAFGVYRWQHWERGRPRAQSRGQAKTHWLALEISRETGIPHSNVHRMVHIDHHAAQTFQTTSCSAVIWSRTRRPSHYPINDVKSNNECIGDNT